MTVDGPKRMSKWYPIFKAPAEVVRQALALDRKQALATVQQMKLDFDSYNENNEGHEYYRRLTWTSIRTSKR